MSRQVAYLLIVGCLLCAQALGVPDGLVGYWSLNEGAGDMAFDASGNGNDGVITGGPTWVEGVLGTALDFEGTNSFVAAPYIPLNERSFTIAMWVNLAANNAEHVAFGQHQAGSTGQSLHIRLGGPGNPATGGINMGFYSNDAVTGGDILELNTWYHLGLVYDIDAQQQRIYVNGELILERTSTPYLGTAGDTRIGQWNNGQWFNGMIDDVQLYQNALTQGEVQSVMDGLGSPGVAENPVPADADVDVLRDTDLSWAPGEFPGTHNVYFGDSAEDVNSATAADASGSATTYDPGRLEFGKTYFWRVDEVNTSADKTVYKGDIWSFEVEPYSVKLPFEAITATASSTNTANTDPNFAIDGSGLDADGMHSNGVMDVMWMSANGDMSPWLMFEFDNAQKLDKMLIWNSNHASEAVIGWGIKDVEIQVSVDGVDWTLIPEPSQLTQGPGFVPSESQTIDMGLAQAKFVRINILNSWGGLLPQYAVAEVQFFAVPTMARTPNPADGAVDIRPDAVVAWRAGREAAQSTIYVDTDVNAVAAGSAGSVSSNTNSVGLGSLDLQMSQTYYWRVDEVNNTQDPSVWAGSVWSLSTSTSLVVEDFESYNNISPNRPFQYWLDGFGYSPDEFFPVEYLGNGTGSGIGHDIWSVGSIHFEGDIMETASTIAGSSQAMPFYYDNATGASTTEHTFAVPQDWTVGGAKTLSIAFNGQAGNTGTLFIVINNVKITYTRDNGNISRGAWQTWNIDLGTLSTTLSNITKLQLGVEGTGSGMILFDDIRLFPLPGELITPVDPGTNGLVAHYSFEGNANDVSGNGNNGTLEGNPAFSAGVVGNAIDLDGIDDYVSTGKTASDLGIGGNNARTISSWVYTNGFANGGIYDVGARAATEDFSLRTLDSIDNRWRVQYWGGDSDFSFPTAGQWVHFVHVHDGVNTKIYANGVIIVDWEKTINTTDTNPFQIGVYGWQVDFFYGLIDEVKVFNRALSAGEAAWLAGITGTIDKPF